MSEHTPGPWEWDAGDIGAEYSVPYSDIFKDAGEIIIASFNDNIPEGRANARLIAAAPDLLEALEDIARGPLQGPGDFKVYAQETARKAVAKARGEPND